MQEQRPKEQRPQVPQKLFQWLERGCQDKDSAGSGAEAKGAEAPSATETIFQWLVRGCQDRDSAGSGAEQRPQMSQKLFQWPVRRCQEWQPKEQRPQVP